MRRSSAPASFEPCLTRVAASGAGGTLFNGSPLFTGDVRSGESELWRRVIEIDRLEAIIVIPDLRMLEMEILALPREVVR